MEQNQDTSKKDWLFLKFSYTEFIKQKMDQLYFGTEKNTMILKMTASHKTG